MAIDPTLKDTLVEHIKRTWRTPGCALCGCSIWELYGHLTLPLADGPGGAPTGDGLPTVAVVCQRCGNTVLVNLVVAGGLVPG